MCFQISVKFQNEHFTVFWGVKFVSGSSNETFPRYWTFVRGFTSHRLIPRTKASDVELYFSLICAWINGGVNNRDVRDLRRHHAHYDVTVMRCIANHGGRRHDRRKQRLSNGFREEKKWNIVLRWFNQYSIRDTNRYGMKATLGHILYFTLRIYKLCSSFCWVVYTLSSDLFTKINQTNAGFRAWLSNYTRILKLCDCMKLLSFVWHWHQYRRPCYHFLEYFIHTFKYTFCVHSDFL